MSSSDLISFIAILVSALSALYAKRSVGEAKKANRISLQFQKVEIYEEVVTFSDCFRGLFSVPTEKRLEQFRLKALNLSELYFSEKIYNQLKEIYTHCRNSEMYLSVVQDNKSDKDLPSEIEIRHDYKSVLGLLYHVIEEMKNEIRIERDMQK